MIIEKDGNIFTTEATTIINTVNCVGVMGAGIAFEFRLRYPKMYEEYQKFCEEGLIDIGKLWMYRAEDRNILAFPTKDDWRYPSKEKYLRKGLEKFLATYKSIGIESVAFPILGADKGGLDKERSLSIMYSYLAQCDIDIEIWHFDAMAKDDKYETFKAILFELDDEFIKTESKISLSILKKIRQGVESPSINSLSGLLRVKGIGEKSLEKLFAYIDSKSKEVNLFTYQDSLE
ncbi:MAG: macro domain-containing protein [Sulfurovaceae bacterium]|nr:macro domain-containing protein [Sulfurovaceae bacterium]